MNNQISLSRVVATATAVLGCRMLAFASPAAAFSPSVKTGSESTPLNLSPSTSGSHAATASTGGASIVRTIVGLAIVIAVIWGLAWIMRQVKAHREGVGDSGQSSAGLASVAALPLGSGRAVHLVRAGNDYVLLGSTEHGVAPIHRYTEEQALDAGLLAEPGLVVAQPVERSRLSKLTGQLLTGVTQGSRHAQRVITDGTDHDDGGIPGQLPYTPRPALSGEVSSRPDPMRMPSPSSGLLERLRELTVRR
jgi:flagellar protein FliO/FliZ